MDATKAPKHQPLDDGTSAALTPYNTYLVADREQRAHERALKKAEKDASVGVEASVGDDDLAGDEPAGVAG